MKWVKLFFLVPLADIVSENFKPAYTRKLRNSKQQFKISFIFQFWLTKTNNKTWSNYTLKSWAIKRICFRNAFSIFWSVTHWVSLIYRDIFFLIKIETVFFTYAHWLPVSFSITLLLKVHASGMSPFSLNFSTCCSFTFNTRSTLSSRLCRSTLVSCTCSSESTCLSANRRRKTLSDFSARLFLWLFRLLASLDEENKNKKMI